MKFALMMMMALSVPAHAQAVDQVVIDKSERTLLLLSGTTTVRSYGNIKLGDTPVGHKRFEGDEKTPEGAYRIDGRNPGSRYYRSLRISYPNAADRAYAARAGRSPGGEIFIHGQPNASPLARLPHDWTDGCIALSNAEMAEVWRLVRTGTRVVIRP